MSKLASFYTQRHCAVVVARSPPLHFFLAQHGALAKVAITVLRETASMIRRAESHDETIGRGDSQDEQEPVEAADRTHASSTSIQPSQKRIPVVVHMFSNGGTFMIEEMDRQVSMTQCVCDDRDDPNDLDRQIPRSSGTSTTVTNTTTTMTTVTKNNNPEYGLVADRIRQYGYLFYDSCPCYLHMMWDLRPHYWKTAFPFPVWDKLGAVGIGNLGRRMYLLVSATSLSLWCLLTGSLQRSRDFWSCISKPPFHAKQLVYVYSTNDKVTDSSRIDDLVRKQQQQHQQQERRNENADNTDMLDVVSYKYDDTEHVDIFNVHSDDYNKAIDDALKKSIKRTYTDVACGIKYGRDTGTTGQE